MSGYLPGDQRAREQHCETSGTILSPVVIIFGIGSVDMFVHPPEKGSLVLLVVVAAAMLAVAAWSSATVFGLIAGRPSRGGELNPWHVPTHGRNALEIVCALAP